MGAATGKIDDISGYELQELFTVPKAKKVAQKRATKPTRDSSLDLAWTAVVSVFILVGRALAWCGRHIVGLAAVGFLLENLMWLQHITGFSFR